MWVSGQIILQNSNNMSSQLMTWNKLNIVLCLQIIETKSPWATSPKWLSYRAVSCTYNTDRKWQAQMEKTKQHTPHLWMTSANTSTVRFNNTDLICAISVVLLCISALKILHKLKSNHSGSLLVMNKHTGFLSCKKKNLCFLWMCWHLTAVA